MGLGNSAGQPSPFDAFARQRRASVATSSAASSPEFKNSFGDEPAVIEEDESTKAPVVNPSHSFARRVSFGAQAMRDARQANAPGSPGAGRRPSSSLFTLDENNENKPPQRRVSPGTAKTAGKSRGRPLSYPESHSPLCTSTDFSPGEGFNWSEALRDRTKRSPSFSASANPFAAANANRARAASTNAPEPPKEMPKPTEPVPMKMRKPDHLGERMLRGDFMMD
jgi:hypothetical protein